MSQPTSSLVGVRQSQVANRNAMTIEPDCDREKQPRPRADDADESGRACADFGDVVLFAGHGGYSSLNLPY